MSSIHGILNAGHGALLTQQQAINVTGHNIANVNTPGYSRQRVTMAATTPITERIVGQVGTGVQGTGVERIYDRFLCAKINTENQSLGKWEAQKDALKVVEVVFNESSGGGLNEAMSEFWNGWQDLANYPSDQSARAALLGKSETMVSTFNRIYSDLQQIQSDLDDYIDDTVQEINTLAGQIADLNGRIVNVEMKGDSANDFRDERDLLMKDLSSLIDFTSVEASNGSVALTLGDANNLVSGSSASQLTTATNAGTGFLDIEWSAAPGTAINANISAGKLKGWIDVRDTSIPSYQNKLETLVGDDTTAGSLIYEVNDLHDGGYGLDNSTGNDFFTGSMAGGDFAVNSVISADADKIAASATLSGVPGDPDNALSIAGLQTDLKLNGSTQTYDDYYSFLVSDVGSDMKQTTISYEDQSEMMTYLDSRRESVSGVSLDEEMVNLIKFQNAYDAAAKLIGTVDEMMTTIINLV